MDDAFGSKLPDFVNSSYTPSLTALIEGFNSPSKEKKALQLIAVAQPFAVGPTPLPGTRKKIHHIQQLADGQVQDATLQPFCERYFTYPLVLRVPWRLPYNGLKQFSNRFCLLCRDPYTENKKVGALQSRVEQVSGHWVQF
jgi:hypothetical protein